MDATSHFHPLGKDRLEVLEDLAAPKSSPCFTLPIIRGLIPAAQISARVWKRQLTPTPTLFSADPGPVSQLAVRQVRSVLHDLSLDQQERDDFDAEQITKYTVQTVRDLSRPGATQDPLL